MIHKRVFAVYITDLFKTSCAKLAFWQVAVA
jgi:hypothetical protein